MENMKLENESNSNDAINKDKVKLELSPYDLTKGRITWRAK